MKIIEPSFEVLTPFGPLTEQVGVQMLQFIEKMARISHRSEDKQTDDSWRRFIQAVVLEHGDWSVVEHASLTVIFRVDRGVTHELVRHRLFCLDGDSKLYFDLPSGQKNRARRRWAINLKKLYKNWSEGQKVERWPGKPRFIPQKDRIIAMSLRMCNEQTGEIENTHIKNIMLSGIKPTYLVELDNGYEGRMTLDHRVLTDQGWKRLGDVNGGLVAVNGISPGTVLNRSGNFRGMRISEQGRQRVSESKKGDKNPQWRGGVKSWKLQVCAWTAKLCQKIYARDHYTCQICGKHSSLSCHHIDPVWHAPEKAFDESNLLTLCLPCNKRLYALNLELVFKDEIEKLPSLGFWARHSVKFPPTPAKLKTKGNRLVRDWAKIVKLTYLGERETFDVEVEGPFHNFVADGLIVHNSFTQESTRFVKYGKDFQDLEFIYPESAPPGCFANWDLAVQRCEQTYLGLLQNGWRPQEARSVLPNALAASIAVTGNLRAWRWLLLARTTRETHPDFKRITIPLLIELKHKIPILFDDIEAGQKQSIAFTKAH